MTSTPTISPTLSKTRRFVVWCTLVAFVAQPMIVTAQVVADPNAGKYQPTVEAAPNGVPLVQITAPTAGGVSRNQYTNYSVEQRGVVLNNSSVVVQSQLAGWIVGNPNLTNGTARIILNEVTSTNPSDLRGYTEVAGSKADVIIANPNGITCNGCGFINTSRGVLTTGTPVFGGDGSLSAFRVTGGNIAITGTGMVGTGADQVDLIARAVQVNAELWAKTLNVITGANQVDYATLATQTIAGSGAAPAVSIDVAALGGMYANKIRLVGTEAGVGVANAGKLIAQAGEISITASGRIVNTGKMAASGNADFAATGLTNSGSIDSRQNMNIATTGDIQNTGTLSAGNNLQASAASLDSTGTLAAGVRDDGTLGTSGNLSVTTTGALVATGTNAAGGDLALQGASLDLRGADNSAGSDLTLTASTGNIDHRGALTSAGGRATLTAAADIDNSSGGSIAARDITLVATGALVNEGGTIEAGNTLTVTAASINNRSGRLANTGTGASTVSASGAIDNTAGLIGGNGAVTLSAASIDNSSGELTAAGRLKASTTGNLTNASGKMLAGTSVDIVAGARLDNTDGRIEAETTAAIKADTLDNTRGRIANAGTGTTSVEGTTRIINASGLIGGNGDLDIRGGAVENAAGALVAGNDLGLTVTTVANNGGQIEATRDLKLAADALTGAGSVLAGRDLDARFSGNFTHDAGAKMQANRNLALSAVGAITNSGEILAVGDLTVSAASLDNRSSGTLNADTTTVTATGSIANAGWISGNTVTTTSDSLTNTGTVIGDTVTINANNLTNRGASAGIYAATALDLLIANAVANLDGAVIYSQGDLNIGASTRRDVDGYLADASASFTNSSGIVEAEGALRISATQITNKRSTLDIQWTAERTGAYTDSGANHYTTYYSNEYVGAGSGAEGKLLSGADTWLKGNILLNEYSVIAAGGNLNLNVGSITNTGRALMEKKSDRGTTDNWQYVVTGSHWCPTWRNPLRRCNDYGWVNYPYAYNQETTYQIGSVDAVMTAGQRVAGVSGALTNQTVTSVAVGATLGANGTTNVSSATGAYTPTLPTSGFYRYHPEPGQRYLIETDPRFASFKNFISSDYMLSRLPFDPQGTQKRLGDGAYEQKLITEQIVQQTGRRFLAGYASAEAEFQALMESGLAAAETFKLKPGIALTGEQVAALTHDMVWMVEQDVTLPNGKHDRVLVPVVYLTRAHSEDLKPDGALIAADDIELQINGTLANSGTLKGSNRLQLAATDIANRGGRIQSAGDLRIDAANDVNNQSGSIAGRRVAIVAGRDLKSERLTEALQLAAVSTTRIRSDAAISASESLDVSAGRDLTLIAARTESGGDTRLQAGRNLSIGTVAASESVANGNGGKRSQTQLGSQLNSGGKLTLIAANDATLTTAELNATQNIALAAGGNVMLAASKESRQSSFSGRGTTNRQLDETARGSQMNAGGQITVLATDFNKLVEAAPTAAGAPAMAAAPERNISLEAASVNSKSGSVTIAADGNLTVKEATERHEAMSETRKSSRGFFSSKSSVDRTESARSDVIGTNINAESITLQSGSDLTVRGSNVTATKDLALSATRDVSVEAATASSASSHYHEEKKSGISASFASGISIGSASAKQSDKAANTTAVVSALGGDNIQIDAGRDATVSGARIIADRNIDVQAGRNVNVVAAQNTATEEHSAQSKSSSMMLAAGFAPRQTIYGSTSTTSQSKGNGNTATAALLSANTGNLTVTAGADAQHANTGLGNVTSQGADLIAGKDVRIEGNAVNLLASEANSQLDSQSQTKSVTVGAALAGTVGGMITRAYDTAKAAQDGTGNSRLDGAMALKAGYDAYKAIDGAGKAVAAAADGASAANGALGNGSAFGVSFSIGTSSSQSESHDRSHNERGTNLQAENIAVKARETDLTAVGAKIEAQRDVTLEAARDLKLLAATNTQSLETSNKSSNASVGVTFGYGQQSGISFQIGASQAKGKSEGSETTYDNTRITAGETLAIKTGGDATLKGAQAGAKRIEADIGGKLAIETLQDRSQYKSQQTSSGFSLSLCIPPICYGTSTGSISAAQQKIDHSYQSAVGQSGLAAGAGGFDINVRDETRLKGAAITSTADAAQNRLATKSLSFEDLTNRQQTGANSTSLSLGGGMDVSQGVAPAPSTSLAGQAATNLLSNLAGQQGLPKNGSEQSQTLAVISPATITLTGSDESSRQAADTLTGRNPATANQALTNTLKLQDAARLQQKMKEAQQNAQAASLIGQVAAGIIGDLSTAMQKPVNDAAQRKALDDKQAEGKPLSNVERYELARLEKEGMTAEKAVQTLKDPAVQANYENWKDGSANKIILHGLAGVITAKVSSGNAIVGATAGAVNEALIPAMSDYLKSQGVTPEKNLEEYKGYMQLGSALLGAGIGAVTKGTDGAALGATVAHNATTFNYLKHAEILEKEARKKQECASNDSACRARIEKEYSQLSQERDRAFENCATADACRAARAEMERDMTELATRARELEKISYVSGRKLTPAETREALEVSNNLGDALKSYDQTWRKSRAVIPFGEWTKEEWNKTFSDTMTALGGLGAAGAVGRVPSKRSGVETKTVSEGTKGESAAEVNSITISKNRFPESAQHIEDAVAAGQPNVLTIDRANAAARRRESLRGVETKPGLDRDEFPPAMFKEGGQGASVKHISPSDNRGAGACIGAQCRGLPDGTKVRIDVAE